MIQQIKNKFPNSTIKKLNNGCLIYTKKRYMLISYLVNCSFVKSIKFFKYFIEIEFGNTKEKEIYAKNKKITSFTELQKYL